MSPVSLVFTPSDLFISRYDMYAGDGRTQNAGILDAQGGNGPQAAQTGTIPEAGPALEVIEMANGETIW